MHWKRAEYKSSMLSQPLRNIILRTCQNVIRRVWDLLVSGLAIGVQKVLALQMDQKYSMLCATGQLYA